MIRLKLTCLRPRERLHDESKDIRMSALQERDEELCLAFSERKKSHFCNYSFFVSKLLDTGNIKLTPTIIKIGTEVDEKYLHFCIGANLHTNQYWQQSLECGHFGYANI